MRGVYDKIYECFDRHPDAFVIVGGYFNACLLGIDSLNRLRSRHELRLAKYI